MGWFRVSKGAVFVVLILVELMLDRFVVKKNSLRVVSPDSIKGTHDNAIDNFGIPQYGGSMPDTVVYSKDNRNSCKSFDDFGISFKAKVEAMLNFLSRPRLELCPILFFLTVKNGGAAAILVADNLDESRITMDTPKEENQFAKYIANITIPSALPN